MNTVISGVAPMRIGIPTSPVPMLTYSILPSSLLSPCQCWYFHTDGDSLMPATDSIICIAWVWPDSVRSILDCLLTMLSQCFGLWVSSSLNRLSLTSGYALPRSP